MIGLTKDVLDRKIMTNFVAFRPKTVSHYNGGINKKAKGTKKNVVNEMNCLQNTIIKNHLKVTDNTKITKIYSGQAYWVHWRS